MEHHSDIHICARQKEKELRDDTANLCGDFEDAFLSISFHASSHLEALSATDLQLMLEGGSPAILESA